MKQPKLTLVRLFLSIAVGGLAYKPAAAAQGPVAPPTSTVAARVAATGIDEESRMARVLDELTPGTLVVFDIDNTLMSPTGHLGSDEWFSYLEVKYSAEGMPPAAATAKADAAFNRVQPCLAMRPVDPDAPRVLAELRRRGVPHFALTARGAVIREITLAQLRTTDLAMDAGVFVPGVAGPGTAFASGVFFIGEGGVTKGEALTRILAKSGLKPARVIFVDDKSKHTRTVAESMRMLGIPCLALRFSAKDPGVAAFRRDLAHHAELLTGEPCDSSTPKSL